VFPDGAIEVRSVVLVAAVSAFAWFMVVAKATFAMSQVLAASAMVMILCFVLQSALLIEDLRGLKVMKPMGIAHCIVFEL
jgi:hypothetical protein